MLRSLGRGVSRRAPLELARRALSSKPPPPHPFESFLNGNSGSYIEDMYMAWRQSPESVHKSWQSVFARMDGGALPGQTFVPPPGMNAGATLSSAVVPTQSFSSPAQDADAVRVMQLVHAYQVRGPRPALSPVRMSRLIPATSQPRRPARPLWCPSPVALPRTRLAPPHAAQPPPRPSPPPHSLP